MPSVPCTVCAHEHREAIDRGLVTKSGSLRSLARQFGLSKDALYRHSKHAITPVKTGCKDVDDEIIRLRKQQANAMRRRDNSAAMKISAELRNWMTLKVKTESYQAPEKAAADGLSRREAFETAKQVIEMEVSAGMPGLREWLEEILHACDVPKTSVQSDAQLVESARAASGNSALSKTNDFGTEAR